MPSYYVRKFPEAVNYVIRCFRVFLFPDKNTDNIGFILISFFKAAEELIICLVLFQMRYP